jgi:hypothetical protein
VAIAIVQFDGGIGHSSADCDGGAKPGMMIFGRHRVLIAAFLTGDF